VTQVTSIAKRQAMAAQGDMTVNAIGPANYSPPMRVANCATVHFVDGLIRDGWIDPSNRETEIIALLQGQLKAARRDFGAEINRQINADYAAGWVDRWMDATCPQP
jgi:hypothetical protein